MDNDIKHLGLFHGWMEVFAPGQCSTVKFALISMESNENIDVGLRYLFGSLKILQTHLKTLSMHEVDERVKKSLLQ